MKNFNGFKQFFLIIYFNVFIKSSLSQPGFSNVQIAFFTKETYYPDYYPIPYFANITKHPAFNKSRTSMIYIHGYTENLEKESVKTVVSAYLTRNDTNIFAVDWSNYSSGNYITQAIPHVIGIGQLIGVCLNYWSERGIFDESRLHLVGHSLGAQMAGYVGKWFSFFSRGTKRIKRITGLDPAKPLWYHNLTAVITYIHKDDAELVDVIHTNAGILGAAISVGNCDFYPNGGTFQPGCSVTGDPKCHHAKSWRFYAESVTAKNPIFDAIQCECWSDFKRFECENGTQSSFMGLHAPTECSGIYFLQTNPTYPFNRGVFGLHYYPTIDSDRISENTNN